jgi:hypothetical protein
MIGQRGITNKFIKNNSGREGWGREAEIYNESGGEAIKEERKVVIKCIEKEYIYIQNLVDVLTKKYWKELEKNKK